MAVVVQVVEGEVKTFSSVSEGRLCSLDAAFEGVVTAVPVVSAVGIAAYVVVECVEGVAAVDTGSVADP